MRINIMWLCMALTGCAVTAKPVNLPTGQPGYAIDCSGGEHDISDCMNKAAEICHGRYDIVNQDGSTGAVGAVPMGRGALFVPMQKRMLIVSCQ